MSAGALEIIMGKERRPPVVPRRRSCGIVAETRNAVLRVGGMSRPGTNGLPDLPADVASSGSRGLSPRGPSGCFYGGPPDGSHHKGGRPWRLPNGSVPQAALKSFLPDGTRLHIRHAAQLPLFAPGHCGVARMIAPPTGVGCMAGGRC